ncbi:MAG: TAT-variant-translocated molybdopterin oxidoreductase [Martelella sp.]|uniref:TAT-variant-translocated molybdopterin oxidoreductase n=1 Tax=Martelella sp. TaxID=1969699 RepID=UPI0032429B47
MTQGSDIFRKHLEGRSGKALWLGLEQLSATEEFNAFLKSEFPALRAMGEGITRRGLLKTMAASFALAGLTGCEARSDENALPYIRAAANREKPVLYATATRLSGYALPVLGQTVAGRPVKLEGNPDHPATSGATDVFLQASLLGLYDPDRSQAPKEFGDPASWAAFDAFLAEKRATLDGTAGAGLSILTGQITSPTMIRQLEALLDRWPLARWHITEPVNEDNRVLGAEAAFGRALMPQPDFSRAETIVSFSDDFLGPGPRQSVNARQWSQRRKAFRDGDGESRILVVEASPSITGARAEARLIAAEQRMPALLSALAARLGVVDEAPELSESDSRWVDDAVLKVEARPGRALVTVGAHHAPALHALACRINQRLGAIGETLAFTEPVAATPAGRRDLDSLIDDMDAGTVSTLFVLDCNPAYAGPPAFAAAMAKVETALHAGLYYDETAALCRWHLPIPHDLESWSDARAIDGTATVLQPLVRPFYSVRSPHTLLANLIGEVEADARAIVMTTWRERLEGDFDAQWNEALFAGFVEGTAAPTIAPPEATSGPLAMPAKENDALTLLIQPDPSVWDGRFGNNGWLQETPKPMTKLTWGNPILISPALAEREGLAAGDVIRLRHGERTAEGPVWILPGQQAETLTLNLGYGHRSFGALADGLGTDAYPLAAGGTMLSGVTLEKTGAREKLASTQLHQAMEGHDFVRTVTAEASRQAAAKHEEKPGSFYPEKSKTSPAWGMSIDLDACIGCNACVVGCNAENNIPVVGKDLVAEGREMHWLRIDRYYEGPPETPLSYFQPVPCMHCEDAPCEMGCPVNATVHSSDGLNVQVYNRCIGTRTCASYCPYKVRRFNWFDYTGDDPEQLRAMRNPEVTVRSRGVMEKCTYCVQRIETARIDADRENRPLRDGEVVTACQQACPTQAISFGDVADPKTEVSRRKAEARDYLLLEEVNTKPRTSYLARVEGA